MVILFLVEFIEASHVLALTACGGGGGTATPATTKVACADLPKVSLDNNTTVTSTQLITGGSFTAPGAQAAITGLPELCRVVGTSKPTSDSLINFEVWLPKSNRMQRQRYPTPSSRRSMPQC